MPKWALDPLLSESTPLQAAGGGMSEGHGAVNSSAADEADSDGEYDSEFSDEDVGRVRELSENALRCGLGINCISMAR